MVEITKLLPKSNYSLLVTFFLEGENNNNKVFAKVVGDKAEELDMDLKSLIPCIYHLYRLKQDVETIWTATCVNTCTMQ